MTWDPIIQKIEDYKAAGKFEDALKVANRELVKNPSNKEILFQIADIQYRKGEILRAEKPIDFLLKGADTDAMSFYIKWVLEMEKTHRLQAKKNFQKTMELMDQDNPEVMRCYGICEYRSGNREKWLELITKAFSANGLDAEILLNLIELNILEEHFSKAKEYISHYHTHKEQIQFFDRQSVYYDEKIRIFASYIEGSMWVSDDHSSVDKPEE